MSYFRCESALILRMNSYRFFLSFFVLVSAGLAIDSEFHGSKGDREALRRTGDSIRAAFASGEVNQVMAYHHPRVIKALSHSKYLVGSEAVRADLLGTFSSFTLTFDESRVESLLLQGDTD